MIVCHYFDFVEETTQHAFCCAHLSQVPPRAQHQGVCQGSVEAFHRHQGEAWAQRKSKPQTILQVDCRDLQLPSCNLGRREDRSTWIQVNIEKAWEGLRMIEGDVWLPVGAGFFWTFLAGKPSFIDSMPYPMQNCGLIRKMTFPAGLFCFPTFQTQLHKMQPAEMQIAVLKLPDSLGLRSNM